MFYILESDLPESESGNALVEIANTFRVGEIRLWKSGKKHTKPVPEPITIPYHTLTSKDSISRDSINPNLTQPNFIQPIEYWDIGIPIMSDRMKNALCEFGVTNIDFYSVKLCHSTSDKIFNYYAFNIIGLVAVSEKPSHELDVENGALNSASSEAKADLTDTSINAPILGFQINSKLKTDLSIFRSEENVNAVLVSQKLKEFLEAQNFLGLRFIEPKNWIQL